MLRKDRAPADGGGGIAFLIHHSVQFREISIQNPDDHLEIQAIEATIHNSQIEIYNIYLPPASSCPGYSLTEEAISGVLGELDGDVLVVGDMNAHHETWHSSTSCDQGQQRGVTLNNFINNSNLICLNTPHPTRLPTNGNPSSPDVSLLSAHLAADATWKTHINLNSDHLPITIDLHTEETSSTRLRKSYTNFRLARWPDFTRETEELFAAAVPTSNAAKDSKVFQKIINKISNKTIPTGYRPNHKPGLTPQIRSLTEQRDSIRREDPTDPTITALNQQITDQTRREATETWRAKVTTATPKSNLKKFWDLIRSLSGKKSHTPPNQPINFMGKSLSKPQSIAKRFNKQFTSIEPHCQDPCTRRIIRKIHSQHKLDQNFSPFTPEAVAKAIRKSRNSTATGPDNTTILHLKHLGPNGINFLCNIFNNSVRNATIPALWKSAIVIPIPKPGKKPEDSKSYRPISLLCPASKILERLVLPFLAILPNNTSQHGFKAMHSTTSALLPLTTSIAQGFNQEKPPSRTAAVAIDFSKAFDSIHHPTLLNKICSSHLHPNIIRWLTCYLRGRTAACRYLSALSKRRIIRSGVPQGAVLSPTLYNFFTVDCPSSARITTAYADDLTVAECFPDKTLDASHLSAHLNDSLGPITDWARENHLKIAPSKSSVTLFTPWTKQFNAHPQITTNNSVLPLEKNPKILGVTFDPQFTFTTHCKNIATKCSSRLNILKALAGTTWGHQKETLLTTYKALIKPVITYAAPIWYPPTCKTNVDSLQVIQNKALRVISGCHTMSPIPHLHAETKVLPIGTHLDMLCKQHLISSLRPTHPSRHYVRQPSGPRAGIRIPTLQSRFLPSISHLLSDDMAPIDDHEDLMREIHTSAVSSYLTAADENELLNSAPPEISMTENSLPRHHRATLSQLRSGYCSRLQDYRLRVGLSTTDTCPECGLAPHTVKHLFECAAHQTTFTPRDLWDRPVEVAAFLSRMTAFSELPPLEPPVPPPPPEPPPPDDGPDAV